MKATADSIDGRHVANREAIEARLVDAMERLIDSGRGFAAVSVAALAREAGIARSTFYFYFRDRGMLLRRLLQRVADEIIEATGVWLAQPEATDRRSLDDAFLGALTVYDRHRAVMTAAIETAAHDASVRAALDDMMARLIDRVRHAIVRLRETGRAHPDADPELAEVLTWSSLYTTHEMLGQGGADRVAVLSGHLAHITWRAVFADGGDRP